jgi:hypothetical protein
LSGAGERARWHGREHQGDEGGSCEHGHLSRNRSVRDDGLGKVGAPQGKRKRLDNSLKSLTFFDHPTVGLNSTKGNPVELLQIELSEIGCQRSPNSTQGAIRRSCPSRPVHVWAIQSRTACISSEILMVAKLEKVSETA